MNEKEKIQNLCDAGCKPEQIKKYEECFVSKSPEEQLKYLKHCRCSLMEELHESQRRVDCMDFLIYKTEKEMQQGDSVNKNLSDK